MKEKSEIIDLPNGAWMDKTFVYITTIPSITIHIPIEFFGDVVSDLNDINVVVHTITNSGSADVAVS